MSIVGTIGARYEIQYTTDVAEPVTWHKAATVSLTQSPKVWIDHDSPGQPKRFYRAVIAQP